MGLCKSSLAVAVVVPPPPPTVPMDVAAYAIQLYDAHVADAGAIRTLLQTSSAFKLATHAICRHAGVLLRPDMLLYFSGFGLDVPDYVAIGFTAPYSTRFLTLLNAFTEGELNTILIDFGCALRASKRTLYMCACALKPMARSTAQFRHVVVELVCETSPITVDAETDLLASTIEALRTSDVLLASFFLFAACACNITPAGDYRRQRFLEFILTSYVRNATADTADDDRAGSDNNAVLMM